MLLAMKGDRTALQLCMDRLLPKLKPATSRFRLPPITTKADLANAFQAVIKAMERGQLSIDEGEGLLRILDNGRRVLETADDRSASGLLDLSVLTDEEFALLERLQQVVSKRKKS
jgi:hypothetical protein